MEITVLLEVTTLDYWNSIQTDRQTDADRQNDYLTLPAHVRM